MAFKFGFNSKRFKKLRSKLTTKRVVSVFGGLVVLFLLLNLITYLAFSSRTYPNAKVADFKIGSVSYAGLTAHISKSVLLPANVSLEMNNKKVNVSVASLGVNINDIAIESGLKHDSWLPLANFFTSHSSPLVLKVDQNTFYKKLSSLAGTYSSSPTNAQIAVQNGTFVVANESDGSSLDVSRSEGSIISGLSKDESRITLASILVKPSVTSATLQTSLKELKKEQALSLSYTYNGKTSKPSAADIAGWFVAGSGNYSVSADKIKAYINQIGSSDGIQVENIDDAVSATQSALAKLTPLSYSLSAVPPVCASNSLSQLILVSISARHLWACNGTSVVYDSPVVTGDEQYADTLTPIGTYHIYSKQTDRTLTGSDENGSWDDFVYYWMPFLDNQYGAYGLHDATWRDASAFGNIDPDSSNASNGCVELPLSTAKWLYNWDEVGTTVTIES